jgi:hypothetical protein
MPHLCKEMRGDPPGTFRTLYPDVSFAYVMTKILWKSYQPKGYKDSRSAFCPVCFSKYWTFLLCVSSHGYGSTDLRLYTSTKQKIANYWLYSVMHKKQNLYLNNI